MTPAPPPCDCRLKRAGFTVFRRDADARSLGWAVALWQVREDLVVELAGSSCFAMIAWVRVGQK